MSMVSREIFCCFSGESHCSVRMLCSRSASLMMMTRMSLAMESSILRKYSACARAGLSKWSPLMWLTPSTSSATSSPNSRRRSSSVFPVSSTTSCRRPAAMVTESSWSSVRVTATATLCV